jgi:DNA polymerase bacteriophage-type
LEGGIIEALQNPEREVLVYRLNGTPTGVSYIYRGDVLYCRVPSGGILTYHSPRIQPSPDAWRGLSVSYMGWNTNPKNGPPGWIRKGLYGGRATENVVQKVARDIQMHAINNLEAAGYPVVLHTYDEVVCEVLEGHGSIEELEAIMATLPDWAKGWPIKAAGGWRAKRYRKG